MTDDHAGIETRLRTLFAAQIAALPSRQAEVADRLDGGEAPVEPPMSARADWADATSADGYYEKRRRRRRMVAVVAPMLLGLCAVLAFAGLGRGRGATALKTYSGPQAPGTSTDDQATRATIRDRLNASVPGSTIRSISAITIKRTTLADLFDHTPIAFETILRPETPVYVVRIEGRMATNPEVNDEPATWMIQVFQGAAPHGLMVSQELGPRAAAPTWFDALQDHRG